MHGFPAPRRTIRRDGAQGSHVIGALPLGGGPVVLERVTVPAALTEGFAGRPAPGAAAQGLTVMDVGLSGGGFRSAEALAGARRIAADGWALLPGLVESHVHLDKTFTVSETGFGDGTLMGAISLLGAASARWTPDTYRRRMDAALAQAEAAGTRHLRTHVDCGSLPEDTPAWTVAQEVRRRWAGRVTVQVCALGALSRALEDSFAERCRQIAAGGVLGAFVPPGLTDTALFERFLRQADAHGLDVDFHIDEGLEPGPPALPALAEAVKATGYGGRVLAGHGCALTLLDEAERERALDAIATAGIAIAALPRTNLFLQDRSPGGTPLRRGVTLVHEMRARGIPVMFGTDNVGDAYYPLGDYDLLRLFADALPAAHIDGDLGYWIDGIAGVPAKAMGMDGAGRIAPDLPADAVLVPARDWPGLLTSRAEDRCVLRGGVPLDNTRDYRLVAQGGMT